jgi:hypothetical protein
MNKDSHLLTKADLRSFAFSEFLIREICKDLNFVTIEKGLRGYKSVDIKEAIINKLSQAKIKPRTHEILQIALSLMADTSNVIEVDFLSKLSLTEKIVFLRNHREELREKGQEILQDIDEILKQARAVT